MRTFTFSLLLILGACAQYRPSQGTFEHHPPLVPAPPPGASQGSGASGARAANAPLAGEEVAGTQPKVSLPGQTANEETRIEPALWGDAAAQAVGRSFDPIYFDFDSAELRFAARRTLKEYADWLADHLEVWIVLEGHCDSTGSAEYNYNLGMARAWAVKSQLVGLGISDARLFTISYGEDRPAIEETAEDSAELEKQRSQNRRVQFLAFIPPPGQKTPAAAAPTSPAPDLKNPEASPEAKEMQ